MSDRGQGGMTLVEMMVAMVIIAIIVASIAQSVILGMQTVGDSNARLTESVGVAFASAYFIPDVESAASVAVNSDVDCDVSGASVARFEWADSDGSRIATYGVRDHNGERSLVRRLCSNGVAGSEIVLVRTISSTLPTPVCEPTACTSTPSTPTVVRLSLNFESGRSVDLSASRRTT